MESHDIADILLKVVLNTITLTIFQFNDILNLQVTDKILKTNRDVNQQLSVNVSNVQ